MPAEITVAIPVFNGARFLEATLRSILAQTLRDFRLVVLDDASEDDSAGVMARVAGERAVIVRNSKRLGITANWNRALSSAETGYLLIAHQDDLYEPAYLVSMATLLDRHPRAFMAHCRASTIDETGQDIDSAAERYKNRFWPDGDEYERDPAVEIAVLGRGNYVMCPSVMLRVECTPAIGTFDERLRFVADWDYWLRGLESGFTIAGTRQRLIRYRRHSASATREAEKSLLRYDEEIALLEKLETNHPSDDPFHAARNSLLAGFVGALSEGDTPRAREILKFGGSRVPGFKSTAASMAMTAALPFGRLSGRLLGMMQKVWTPLGQ